MAKKTITVSGQRVHRSLTGIQICRYDKSDYDAFLRKLPEDAHLRITLEFSDPRQDWIDDMHRRACTEQRDGCIFIKYCKETTIVAPFGLGCDREIGLSAPRHGDKYDRKTGIAVAYAKAIGEVVPDYV